MTRAQKHPCLSAISPCLWQNKYALAARERDTAQATIKELAAALRRIADAKVDGFDGTRDGIVLSRAIRVARAALAKVRP